MLDPAVPVAGIHVAAPCVGNDLVGLALHAVSEVRVLRVQAVAGVDQWSLRGIDDHPVVGMEGARSLERREWLTQGDAAPLNRLTLSNCRFVVSEAHQ